MSLLSYYSRACEGDNMKTKERTIDKGPIAVAKALCCWAQGQVTVAIFLISAKNENTCVMISAYVKNPQVAYINL